MRKLGVLATLAFVVALALPLFTVQAQDGVRATFDLGPDPAPDGPLAGVDPSGQTVVWWHQHSREREEFLMGIIEDFNANNPWGITIDASNQGSYGDIYSKMIAGIESGDVPDLVVAYQNQSLAYDLAGGLVEDMDVYVNDPYWGLSDVEKEDFIPGFFTQDYTADGRRIGFPPNRSIEAMYYNRTALEELGYDGPPTSWDEFMEMACAFTESGWSGYDGEDTIGYTIRTDASQIAAGAFANGGDVFVDGQFTYNSPETIEYIQFMVDLYNAGCGELIAEAYGDQNNFAAGRALFYMGSTSGLPFVRRAIEDAYGADAFVWGATFLPYKDAPVADIYGASVSMVKSTPEKQLATWLFIRWMTETDQQTGWAAVSNYFPVRFSSAEAAVDLFADFPQYAETTEMLRAELKIEPQIASYDVIRDEAQATFDNLLAGGGDVEVALTELNVYANNKMADFTP